MKTTVVVGAGGRLGGHVVGELLARGHRVVGVSRDPAPLTDRFGARGEFRAVAASASDADDMAAVLAETEATGWRVQGLVVCVGGWWQGELLRLAPAEWRELEQSHLTAHFLAVRTFAAKLAAAADGACVLTGGVGTEQIVPGSGAISVFGAAQRALLLAVRQEAGDRFRCQEVAIMGPLAEDERNEPGDPAVPAAVAARAVADTLEARLGAHAVIHIGPHGPLTEQVPAPQ